MDFFANAGGPILTGVAYGRPSKERPVIAELHTRNSGQHSSANNTLESDLALRFFGEIPLRRPSADFRFSPGSSHLAARQLGLIHPDNAECISRLTNVLSPIFSDAQVVTTPFFDGSLDGAFVCAGGALSNSLTRIALQYVFVGDDPAEGVRISDTPFDLKYELVQDVSFARKEFGQATRSTAGGILTVPNWAIIDRKSGRAFTPRTDGTGLLLDDYLLVTRVPNITAKNIGTHSSITIFSGCHGVGTRSAHLVFEPELLRQTVSKISSEYWQALFHIECQSDESSGRLIPIQAQLVDVAPANLGLPNIQKWIDERKIIVENAEGPFGFQVPQLTGAGKRPLRGTKRRAVALERNAMEPPPNENSEEARTLLLGLRDLRTHRPETLAAFLEAFLFRREKGAVVESQCSKALEATIATLLLTEPDIDESASSNGALRTGSVTASLNEESANRLETALLRVCQSQPTIANFAIKTAESLGVDAATLLRRSMDEYVQEMSYDSV